MNRIREIREDRDYTQDDIAKLLHVQQNTYSRYETGTYRVPERVYRILADFYETSVDYLMYRTDVREAPPKSIMEDVDKDVS